MTNLFLGIPAIVRNTALLAFFSIRISEFGFLFFEIEHGAWFYFSTLVALLVGFVYEGLAVSLAMLGCAHYPQIRRLVVGTISVYMMNMLQRCQPSIDYSLHYMAMLGNIVPVNPNELVAIVEREASAEVRVFKLRSSEPDYPTVVLSAPSSRFGSIGAFFDRAFHWSHISLTCMDNATCRK